MKLKKRNEDCNSDICISNDIRITPIIHSTVKKPTKGISNGQMIIEKDTGDMYVFYSKTSEWIKISEYHESKEETVISKPITNADRIRSMTDDELYRFLMSIIQSASLPIAFIRESDQNVLVEDWLEWLKQEAKEQT